MLEVLVLSICIKGSADACENSTVAYYKQSGLEKALQGKESYYSARYPATAMLLTIAGTAYQGRATIPIAKDRSIIMDSKKSIIGFKTSF